MSQITISRKKNILDSKCGADCKFLVGANFGDIVEEIFGHKAIFANASSVFQYMFYGSMPEEGEIKIPDIHPEIFYKMIDFFYTGEVTIISVEQAVEVWYVADKYNIEDLLKCIPDYIIKNITPQNVCCLFKFSVLYRNEVLIKKCEQMIRAKISTVLEHSSFLEADVSALSFILDQNELNISEIEIFRALVRYDNARKNNRDAAKSVEPSSTSGGTSRPVDLEVKEDNVSRENVVDPCGEGSSHQEGTETQGVVKANGGNPVKELVKKIRFLTMTSEEFSECVQLRSSLLSISEALSIFVNISTPTGCTYQMPEEFCDIREMRKPFTDAKNLYCDHAIEEGYTVDHTSGDPLQLWLEFKCNAEIIITGIQVNDAVVFSSYDDTNVIMDITITNERHCEVFHQRFTLVESMACHEIVFDNPVHIDPRRMHTITFTSDDIDLDEIQEYVCYNSECTVGSVTFIFNRDSDECNCKGFIRSIIFAIQ